MSGPFAGEPLGIAPFLGADRAHYERVLREHVAPANGTCPVCGRRCTEWHWARTQLALMESTAVTHQREPSQDS